ncbi:hypothetical protein WDW37_12475 [Bdellovibrionota bacterium FG-1]
MFERDQHVRITSLDRAANKLLANSDCWADDAVFSRDLIDLAMLEPSRAMLARAIAKAAIAYGESIKRDLDRAIQRLEKRTGRLDECMTSLKMDRIPKALLWKRIRKLRNH